MTTTDRNHKRESLLSSWLGAAFTVLYMLVVTAMILWEGN